MFEDPLSFDLSNLEDIAPQCKYYSFPSDMPQTNEHFSVIHINARSIKNKFDDLQNLLAVSGVNWSVICITETWLKQNQIEHFHMEDYNVFASCREDAEGGGSMIYIKKQYDVKEREDLHSNSTESILVEIQQPFSNGKNVIIGSIYRPPSFSNRIFFECFEKLLGTLENEKKMVILGGDFNYNLLDINDQPSFMFNNLLASYGYSPTISKPTRVQKEKCSLLDNFYINHLSYYYTSGVIIDDLSDHFPVFLSLSFKTPKKQLKPAMKKVFDKSKIIELNQYLVSKLNNFEKHTDANEACEVLVQTFVQGMELYSKVVKTSTRKTAIKPWVTPALLCSINNKNKLYKKFLKSPNIVNENKYKQCRNILANVLKDAKRLYYQKSLEVSKNSSKNMWKLLNEVTNQHKHAHSEPPSTFHDSSGKVYNKKQIADEFNKFFSNIGSLLENEIPSPDSSPLEFLPEPSSHDFETSLMTSASEVEAIIKSMNHVGGGVDGISTEILQLTYHSILNHLTFFFNLCLQTAVFPNHLKIAIIKPIYKAGDKNTFNNYRPISMLPTLSKILEKILHSRIYECVNEHSILNPFQFGFRKNHSTYMPIAHLIDVITGSLQENLMTFVLYLDLKKAFDTVNSDVLLKKIFHIGIRGNLYSILRSYLTDRKQKTVVHSYSSDETKVELGVPQGSILGPLLFILYINDISNITDLANFYLFADDTAIVIRAPNLTELQAKLHWLLPLVATWFQCNRLSLNTTKTFYQIFSRTPTNDLRVVINNTKIERKSTVKYLGILIDDNLKWDSHINNVSKILSRNLGVISRAKFFLSSNYLLLLYNALILPYLNYCAAVWGSNYPTKVDKLIKLQKRAIRIIDKKPYFFHTRDLFIKYKILKFPELVKEQQLVILLGHLKGTLPSPIHEMFKRHAPVNTRTVQHFEIPHASTNYRAFSLSISAPRTWNSIVCTLFRDISDVPFNKFTFKKYIREYLLQQYEQS